MNLTVFELPGAEFALRRCLGFRRGVDPRDMRKSDVRFVIAFTTPAGGFCTAGADSEEQMLRIFERIYRASNRHGLTDLRYDHSVRPATLHRLEAFAEELRAQCASEAKAARRLH